MTVRCAVYSRYSSDLQSPTSIADQLALCRAHAERQAWTVVATFHDAALSGVGTERAGYQRLLAAAFATPRAFDIVLVEDLSRLTRDTGELLRLHQRLQLRGIEIVGVSDGIRSSAQGATVALTVRGLSNTLYLEDLRAKTHRGLRGLVDRGLSAGGACYGYRTVKVDEVGGRSKHAAPARIEIEEREAGVVRRIFHDYIAGQSPRAIADALNREGLPCPGRRRRHGAPRRGWDRSTLHVVLKNEKYAGIWVWNKTRFLKDPESGRRRAVARPVEEWVRTERPELRIVDAETWQAAQQRAVDVRDAFGFAPGAPVGRASRAYSPRLLSGLVTCGVCGANLVGQTTRRVKKSGRVYSYRTYRCGAAATKGSSVCAHGASYRADRLESQVIDRFRTATSPRMIDALVALVNTALHSAIDRRDETVERIKREIADLERKTGNLVRFIADGGRAPTLRTELVAMEDALQALREQLSGADTTGTVHAIDATWVRGHIERLGDLLHRDPVQAKAEIARHLTGPLVLTPLPGPEGQRRAEISGGWKRDGLLANLGGPTRRPVARTAGCGGWI
jgi:site-specific DNA recombinase